MSNVNQPQVDPGRLLLTDPELCQDLRDLANEMGTNVDHAVYFIVSRYIEELSKAKEKHA